MKQTKKLSRKVISYVLALVMVFSTMTGIVPRMSITAQAAPAETLLTTITPTGKDTYSESTAGVVNVTLSDIRKYSDGNWAYGGTVTVTPVEGYTITKCRFNTKAGAVDDTEAPFSIDVRAASYVGAVEVYGYQTSAQAADPVPYIYYTNNASTEGTCTDYTTVATDTKTWGTAGNTTWYVVSGEVTISSRVTVNGTVNLILRDGAKLTVNDGIGLNDGNTLNIYPETEDGTGELNAVASTQWSAGIGGTANNGRSVACGTLTIHGGVIKATGAENGPGIGNSGSGAAQVTPEAGRVIIYAGNVTATGGSYGGAGIGGGYYGAGGCNVEIYGGTVRASVGSGSPRIGAQGIGYGGGIKAVSSSGTLKIGDGLKVYSDAAGTTELATGPQDNVTSRTNIMFVKSFAKPKSAQTVTAPTKATDLTYQKDQAQELLTSGAVVKEGNKTEGSIKYKVGDDGTWSSEIPKETNAGTYNVYYKVLGDDTYEEYAPVDPIPVTIAKADPETPEAFSAIYGQQAKDITLPTGWSWANPETKFESSGGVELKANFKGDDNYNQKNDVKIYGTVAKAAAKISYTFSEVVKEYGSKSFTNEITNTGDVTPTYISSATSVATVDGTGLVTIKGIGETTITANVAEDNDHYTYETRKASYKLIVNPKSDDIKAAQAVIDKINGLNPAADITPSDRAAIEAARKAYDDLTDDQKAILAKLDPNAVATLEAAEKAAFDAEKEAQKKAADALTAEGDSDASKKLIEDAKKAIDALAYDETKSLDENKKAVAAILTKLKEDLTTQRAADKKEADDTADAKKVTDAINKLPASDKIATTDKAAIAAARKAYDALTADQKKKVPADVLKKLTDAEAALKTAEAKDKAAKELEAAKAEAQVAMNEQVTVTQKGNKFTVKWKKSSSADGYYVYASYCGKKAAKPAKTIKKNTTTKVTISKINGKKINQKKNFHVYVVPYKIIDGKKVTLGKSTVEHLVGSKNAKYSNVKKLTLTKSKYTVKVGKTAKIKAKVTLVNKNKKHISKGHGDKFRYKSSDTGIATVDKNGKIKGIKKGTCTIYVYSINGLMKKAKVTIK